MLKHILRFIQRLGICEIFNELNEHFAFGAMICPDCLGLSNIIFTCLKTQKY